MFNFLTPYFDMYKAERFKLKPKPVVIHCSICTDCGSNRVNIYYSAQLDRYICKKCLDKFLSEKSGVQE